MARMKTFRMWTLIIIAFFIYSTVITNLLLKDTYKNIYGEVVTNSPKIEITEAKAGKNSGSIKGKITNDTDENINRIYIKIDFYSKHNTNKGTEYIEINDITENEKREFSSEFNFKNVEKYEVSYVEEILETDNKKFSFNSIVDNFVDHINGISKSLKQ